jgi:hypothetical protein
VRSGFTKRLTAAFGDAEGGVPKVVAESVRALAVLGTYPLKTISVMPTLKHTTNSTGRTDVLAGPRHGRRHACRRRAAERDSLIQIVKLRSRQEETRAFFGDP